MAAMVHGCGSPRQVHGNSGNIATAANNGCLPSSGGVGHRQHSGASSAVTTMYPNTPKYATRNAIQQQLGGVSANHHHVYTAANPTTAHKYNPSLPPVSYYPSQTTVSPYSSATLQRPVSVNAANDSCRTNYWSQPHAATMIYRNGRHYSKRKSAVELLAETKQYYIKSDAALERLHQSNYRASNTLTGTKRGRSSAEAREDARCNPSSAYRTEQGYGSGRYMGLAAAAGLHASNSVGRSGSHMHHHHHHSPHGGRSMPTGSNALLQSKLRMMFNADAAARDLAKMSARTYRDDLARQVDFEATALSKDYPTVSFAGEEDSALRTPPPSFLSSQPYSSGAFNYGVDTSSVDEPLVLTENYRPISPPAEYAGADSNSQANNEQRSRYNYQRSYSHSHEMAAENAAAYNINSHKSLPDLHSQISRHSPHSEILSCCSRGNRSIKSAGESSLNRDSGGSSGHYTHRSEPCYRQHEVERDSNFYGAGGGGSAIPNCCQSSSNALPKEYRRDSGSSTQHSANSYCGYASPSYPRTADCSECRCKAATTPEFDSADFLLNFTTPEVPEAFQDDYTPPSPSVMKPKLDEPRYSSSSSQQLLSAHSYGIGSNMKHHSQSPIIQSPGSAPSVEEISPPPMQFKRQKCIRFKNRSRISLPSAAVHGGSGTLNECNDNIVYRGRGSAEHQAFVFPKCFSADGYGTHEKSQSLNEVSASVDHTPELEGFTDLERFFDRLGLNDDKFNEIYSATRRRRSGGNDSDDSSTVFFSDVSTVDSMRLPDSTETQPQTTATYRPSEPPSIVERNARIIKWLCNCRKVQYAL